MTAIITACTLLIATGEPIECPPQIPHWTEICVSLTTFWPFDEEGELVAWAGQADSTPQYTAVMHEITGPEQAYTFVAAPSFLLGSTICLAYYGCLPVLDTFGDELYRAGIIYNEHWQQWVLPVDLISPDYFMTLICDWRIE